MKVLGTYPNDNDELVIAKRGSMTSGSTSFSSLDGIGSNIHVVGLDDLTSLYNSSSPIVENEWNCVCVCVCVCVYLCVCMCIYM